jgi:hypothetical protein
MLENLENTYSNIIPEQGLSGNPFSSRDWVNFRSYKAFHDPEYLEAPLEQIWFPPTPTLKLSYPFYRTPPRTWFMHRFNRYNDCS